ncbi:hypothetical protein WKS98_08830 [Lagierella sp. ICN-221743]
MRNPFDIDQEQIRLLKLIKQAGIEVDKYLDYGRNEDCMQEVNKVLMEMITKDFVTTADTGKALEEVTDRGVNLSDEELKEALRKSADTFHSVKKALDQQEMLEVVKEVLRVESYITFLETDVEEELKNMEEE